MSIKTSQIFLNLFFIVIAAACIIPFVLLCMASITDDAEILRSGYSLIPNVISFKAYDYLFNNISSILKAYGITVLITVVGTMTSLLISSLLAYPLSRKEFFIRKPMTFFVFFTMLFNGGLVPTYILYSQYMHFKNTIFALIIPILLMKAFYVLIIRTFFVTSIPDTVLESARIDGAGEWRIFFQIVLKLSYPVLATVGLFQAVSYWNDWFNGLIFITNKDFVQHSEPVEPNTAGYSVSVNQSAVQLIRSNSVYPARVGQNGVGCPRNHSDFRSIPIFPEILCQRSDGGCRERVTAARKAAPGGDMIGGKANIIRCLIVLEGIKDYWRSY